jgi:four helix bundle protein
MRRCSVSIPSNIAEGYARKNKKENVYFVSMAYGSATELETQVIISKRLNFVSHNEWKEADNLLEEVLKLSYNYRTYLQK